MTDITIHEKTYPFDPIAIVNQYTSFIWNERLIDVGDFELHLPMNKTVYDLLDEERMLSIRSTTKRMIIESREIRESTDGEFDLIVKGRSLESILDRRIVLEPMYLSGTLDLVLQQIIDDNVIDTNYAPRNIPYFIYEESDDPFVLTRLFSSQMIQFYTEEVLQIVIDYCSISGIGFQIELDSSNNFVFKLYAGLDRSLGQLERQPLVFSKAFDNLNSTSYFRTIEFYKTDTLVVGQIATDVGKFPPEWLVLVEDGVYEPGLRKRETATDGSDINRYTNTDVLIPLYDYASGLLEARGKDDLLNYKKVQTYLEASIETSQLTYRTDYSLGDLISYRDSFGNFGAAIITEVVISDDQSGFHIFPILVVQDETYYDIESIYAPTLLVAGGGGGGYLRAGGGAGGEVVDTVVKLEVGTTYNVVVGAGGLGVAGASGLKGADSTFAGETALGGGYGGRGNTTGSAAAGGNGGNGGGGGGNTGGLDGAGGLGKYNGGNGSNGPTNYGGGGGGGDGQEGWPGYSGAGADTSDGGDGSSHDITGTPTYYGGGGGGYGSTSIGDGGLGGGGTANSGGAGGAGTNGLGGGGGAGSTIGGNGGSGSVTFRVPTSVYTAVYTGSPTISVIGSYTIIKFTANGSYTA